MSDNRTPEPLPANAVKSDPREIEIANEQNEWAQRLEGLAAVRKKIKKNHPPRKFKRVSQRQRIAIGRR